MDKINQIEQRTSIIRHAAESSGPVVYWMSRDQRCYDNWALVAAQQIALQRRAPLMVVFCLVTNFLNATLRPLDFMLRGLEEVEEQLREKNIGFWLVQGDPGEQISRFCKKVRAGMLVTDFDPLPVKRHWRDQVAAKISIPFRMVDAHNVVPCWRASGKQEYSAYTFRIKINRVLSDYFVAIPMTKRHPFSWGKPALSIKWNRIKDGLNVDRSVSAVQAIQPGYAAGTNQLRRFIKNKLERYAVDRNDPTLNGGSGLSAYFHFGQISTQRAAWEAMTAPMGYADRSAFLEQLIIRRELSDNFVLNNPHYDRVMGFQAWAKKTLIKHRGDQREYTYTTEQFASAQTHDPLWNAAQHQLMESGSMHGYMRMYWAKKILEWSTTPESALKIGIFLNDRYQLDGRDPNGYTGLAWSIGGVHDRPWGERPVFGQIRFMNDKGCARKFDVPAYIRKWKRA